MSKNAPPASSFSEHSLELVESCVTERPCSKRGVRGRVGRASGSQWDVIALAFLLRSCEDKEHRRVLLEQAIQPRVCVCEIPKELSWSSPFLGLQSGG